MMSLRMLFKVAPCALVAAFFLSCAGAQKTERAPLYRYKADILFEINGLKSSGMVVVPLTDLVKIKMRSKARLDLLMISSCHRTYTIEKVDEGWFGGAAKEFVYEYRPTEIEKSGFCPVYFQAFDKNGITAWGMLAFKTTETLKATLQCSGTVSENVGVSICQAKSGLTQGIKFSQRPKFIGNDKCEIKESGLNAFEVRANSGFCNATFMLNKEIHRLVLLGFDEVLVRE